MGGGLYERLFVMGLIEALRRHFQTRVSDLVREDRALLERAIGGVPYELLDEQEHQCRVVTDDFTVTFTWDRRDRSIESAIRLHESTGHPLDPHLEYSAREWLEAQGLSTLPRRSGPKSAILLRDELESLRQVVAKILPDARKAREALFYLDGYMRGYNDRVLVPEEAPPRVVTEWIEERLGLRGS